MRCRNCGSLEHVTRECTQYGPWFPEEGKTVNDYDELTAKIGRLIAGDILAEYHGNHIE